MARSNSGGRRPVAKRSAVANSGSLPSKRSRWFVLWQNLVAGAQRINWHWPFYFPSLMLLSLLLIVAMIVAVRSGYEFEARWGEFVFRPAA